MHTIRFRRLHVLFVVASLALGIVAVTTWITSAQAPPSLRTFLPVITKQTEFWSSYTSISVGVTMKLPPSWYPHEVTAPAGTPQVYISAPVDNPWGPQVPADDQKIAMMIWRENNTISQSLEDWALKKLTEPYGLGPARREYLLLDGKPALQLQFNDHSMSLTAVDVAGYRYLLHASVFGDGYASQAPLILEVLNTIRFHP